MKKNSSLRLKLHRETLGNLTSDQMGVAQGGALVSGKSACRTCGCPPPPTQSCPIICETATSQTC